MNWNRKGIISSRPGSFRGSSFYAFMLNPTRYIIRQIQLISQKNFQPDIRGVGVLQQDEDRRLDFTPLVLADTGL